MPVQLNKFSAWICIDEVERPQYSIEYSSDGTLATCWIASEAGKNFSVAWRNNLCTFSCSATLSVDGISGGGGYSRGIRGEGTHHKEGFRTSGTTRRLFMFSKLKLTDDDRFFYQGPLPEIGEIKLEIRRCTILREELVQDTRLEYATGPERIHERCKKAFDHRVTLGPEVHYPPSISANVHQLEKVATFVFKYRPLAQLQANRIVPVEKKRKRCLSPRQSCSRDNKNTEKIESERIRALKVELSLLERRRNERQKRIKTGPLTAKREPPATTRRRN